MAAKKRAGKHKSYYERQKEVTVRHKIQQTQKREKDLAFWIAKGVKKNGEKVLTLAERKVRAERRGECRREARALRRAQRLEAEKLWQNSKREKEKARQPRFKEEEPAI